MSGRRGTEMRRMSSAVLVRLPDDLAARLEAAARDRSLTAAAYLRALATADLEIVPPPVPVRRRRDPPSEAVLAVAYLRESVAETCGALVKAAVMARTDGAAVLHAEIEAVLPAIRQHALDLDRVKAMLMRRSS